jgi:hypothetical protein
VPRQQSVEQRLTRMLEAASEKDSPGRFTASELRDFAREYLDDYDEELARDPELADESHWDLWMNDADLHDALFVIMIVRGDGLEFFCGRGQAWDVRNVFDNWVADPDGLRQEVSARFAVPGEAVRLDRRAAEKWLGRGLRLHGTG